MKGSDCIVSVMGPDLWSDGFLWFNMKNGNNDMYAKYATQMTGWHYVTMVFDGTKTGDGNRLKGYLDGALLSLTYGGAPIPATTPINSAQLYLGREDCVPNNNRGKLDDVRVYNRALSATEVKQLYNMGR